MNITMSKYKDKIGIVCTVMCAVVLLVGFNQLFQVIKGKKEEGGKSKKAFIQ